MKQGLIARLPRATGRVQVVLMLLCLSLLTLAMPALSITLVSDGSTTYVIAKKTGCDSTESQAATDIQSYINQISGVTIPINSYTSISTVPANAIVIGTLTTSPTLTLEQIEMKVSSARLILRGGSSLAHRYAVFTFLEDQLGCRYYAPTVEYVPTMSSITVSDSYTSTQTPSFEYRYLMHEDVEDEATWCVKNKVNGQIDIDGTHNIYSIVPVATYWSTHPEYYPMKGGVRVNNDGVWLCFTNTNIAPIIANYVIGRMAATDANTIINVGQGDGWGSCECSTCQAAYTAEGSSWNGVMLRCLNVAANTVAQTYPNRKMMTFAYMGTEKPGTVTHPVSNLIIRLCHWQRCDFHNIDTCTEQDGFETNLASWQSYTTPQQLYIWDYGTNFNNCAVPYPNVSYLIPRMKYYYDHDVRGMTWQGTYWCNGGDLSWLKSYLLAKVLWNKDANYTTVYNDFTNGYYGAAGDEMRTYINYLETQCANYHSDGINDDVADVQANLMTPSVLAQADTYFNAAETAAAAVSQALYDRVHYDRASLLFMHIWENLQLSRISSPADRLVKNGDNNFYTWKNDFFSVIGNRGCGGEFRQGVRSVEDLGAQQAGDVYVIENNKIKISACPGMNGAIISIIDKVSGRELLAPSQRQYETTEYPFNGYYYHDACKSDASPYTRTAGTGSIATLGDNSKELTMVCNTGIGQWTPPTDTHRTTTVITLPPGNSTSFTVVVKEKNLTGDTTYSDEMLQGRLALVSCTDWKNIVVTLPNDTTQNITTFPTTVTAKQIQMDNTRAGVRITKAFSTSLTAPSATFSKNTDGTFNTTFLKYTSGTYSLSTNEEETVLNETWTLTPITPSSSSDITWQDFYNTAADYTLGSQLYRSAGTPGWSADARSTQTLTGDGYVEWMFTTQGAGAAFALSPTNPNHNLQNLKFGIRSYNSSGAKYRPWENNAYVGTTASHSTTDIDLFRIERIGSTVKYYANGNLIHTSAQSSSGETLFADCCIYDVGTQYGFFNCVVKNYVYPTVSITSPTAGAVYAPGSNITINATASDSDGSITKVEFFRGTTKLGEDTSSPYSHTWNNAGSGSYSLTAKAYDNDQLLTTSSAVNIRVNTLPTTSITAPADESEFEEPADITITANASDSDGSISKVEFYKGTTKLGEDSVSPYSYNWQDVPEGAYTLTAKAIDNDNGATTSTAVDIDVINPGEPITWIHLDNTTADYATGSKLYKSAGGAGWGADARSQQVLTGDGAIEFTFLTQGASSGGAIMALVESDPNASSNLKFGVRSYLSGGLKYYRAWENGTYVGTAVEHSVGTDVFKIQRVGSTVSLYVNDTLNYTYGTTSSSPLYADNCIYDQGSTYGFDNCLISGGYANSQPSVSITSPTNNATYQSPASITINANASDSDGTISKVEFYNGTTLLGTDSVSPYSYNWTGVTAGAYTLTAVATDNYLGITTSSPVAVVVRQWITWQDFTNTTADYTNGSKIYKSSGGTGWNGDARSTQTLTGDGYVEFTFLTQGASSGGACFGIEDNDGGDTASAIDFGVRSYLSGGTKYYRAWQAGTYVGTAVAHSAGTDVFKIQRVGTTIYLYVNGSLYHTFANTSGATLFADFSIYDQGSTYGFDNCVIYP